MRRLPPTNIEVNLSNLIHLIPELTEDLLSAIDQPLKVAKCKGTGKEFLLCDYNRDGDSYRWGRWWRLMISFIDSLVVHLNSVYPMLNLKVIPSTRGTFLYYNPQFTHPTCLACLSSPFFYFILFYIIIIFLIFEIFLGGWAFTTITWTHFYAKIPMDQRLWATSFRWGDPFRQTKKIRNGYQWSLWYLQRNVIQVTPSSFHFLITFSYSNHSTPLHFTPHLNSLTHLVTHSIIITFLFKVFWRWIRFCLHVGFGGGFRSHYSYKKRYEKSHFS